MYIPDLALQEVYTTFQTRQTTIVVKLACRPCYYETLAPCSFRRRALNNIKNFPHGGFLIPYSGKLSRVKIFANFVDLGLSVKDLSANYEGVVCTMCGHSMDRCRQGSVAKV